MQRNQIQRLTNQGLKNLRVIMKVLTKKEAVLLLRTSCQNSATQTIKLECPGSKLCLMRYWSRSLKEMLKTLCLVSRRWRHIVNNNNILWSCLLLDEWHITYLSEEQFMNIMSHSSGFRYLSIRYIEMTTSEMIWKHY